MKKVLNIAFLLFFVAGVSSCAKEELDSPSETANPQAVMSIGAQDELQFGEDDPSTLAPLPTGINDDGDNEDEGINNNGPSKEGE